MICSQLCEMCPLGSQANHSGLCFSPQSVEDARVLQPRTRESQFCSLLFWNWFMELGYVPFYVWLYFQYRLLLRYHKATKCHRNHSCRYRYGVILSCPYGATPAKQNIARRGFPELTSKYFSKRNLMRWHPHSEMKSFYIATFPPSLPTPFLSGMILATNIFMNSRS